MRLTTHHCTKICGWAGILTSELYGSKWPAPSPVHINPYPLLNKTQYVNTGSVWWTAGFENLLKRSADRQTDWQYRLHQSYQFCSMSTLYILQYVHTVHSAVCPHCTFCSMSTLYILQYVHTTFCSMSTLYILVFCYYQNMKQLIPWKVVNVCDARAESFCIFQWYLAAAESSGSGNGCITASVEQSANWNGREWICWQRDIRNTHWHITWH